MTGAALWAIARPFIVNVYTIAGLLMFVAFYAGFYKGVWQTQASMISAIEKASLEAEIANLKNEKAIAEAAAKQAETDKSDLEDLASQQQGEINAYRDKLEKAGRKCELSPSDYCDIYGLRHPKCKRDGKKTSYLAARLARYLQAHRIAVGYWQCPGRLEGLRRDRQVERRQAG